MQAVVTHSQFFSHRLWETISVAEIWPAFDWAVCVSLRRGDPWSSGRGVDCVSHENKAKIGFER